MTFASTTRHTASRRSKVPALVPPPPRADEAVSAPGLLLLLLEARAPLEGAALLATLPWLNRLPQGDGHAVLVFPGLGAGDITTLPLRRCLHARGYTPYGWEQGVNLGPRDGVLDACRRRLQHIAQRHGQRVSLIGWSLGGIYAREVAKLLPEHARCVITLGSPFSGHPRATNAWRFYQLVSGQRGPDAALAAQVRTAPACPTTSIFSRSDGIVAWPCSINDSLPNTENIEVPASHIGMGLNPLVLHAIADRLVQDPSAWQRFDISGARRLFFRHGTMAAAPASTPV